MTIAPSIDAGERLTLALAEIAAINARAVERLDAMIAQIDTITAANVARLRAALSAFGVDDETIEWHVSEFVCEFASGRAWLVAERNRAALGVTDGMGVAPPQV
jgi:alkylation response protein AidB-like acyl-CoA dehydrogenase